jgi:hypothetical protein
VTFGIKNKAKETEETFEFLASTAKIVTLKLDMKRLLFKSWVNLSPVTRNSTREVTEGEWTPFVRFKVKGRSLILNPNPLDPEGEVLEYNPWSEFSSLEQEGLTV